jgi:hypothetical protein
MAAGYRFAPIGLVDMFNSGAVVEGTGGKKAINPSP